MNATTIPGSAPARDIGSVAALIAFFVLTFVWTWGLWGISSLIKGDAPGLSNALFLASAFGPGLAAAATIVALQGKAGLRRWLITCLAWRVGWHWHTLAALVPPLIMLAALGITAALGGTTPAFPDAGHLLVAAAQFPLVAIFGGPLGEEFGWRGFALPGLSGHLGWRRASLIVGDVWALWHLPLLLMTGTAQADLPMALFVASTIGLSVVMGRLSAHTGFSVLPAILLHSMINWCSMVLPIMPKGGVTRAYALVAGITILIALAALVTPGPRPALR